MHLSHNQQRILGCLLEKQSTTPEHYPLSLNSLTSACNQKSNREPVLSLAETQVQETLDELIALHLVTVDEGLSGRVNKYAHRFCNTEFSSLQFTEQQRAIICLLLLRGPQTPGELRTRSNRLAEFNNVNEVEAALNTLIEQEYVARLAREPGKRESRYMHLFVDPNDTTETMVSNEPEQTNDSDVQQLRAEIEELRQQINSIKAHLGL